MDVGHFSMETDYTIHYFERLMPTCRDRGRWKWIAETKPEAYGNKEASHCHIDHQDLFPRLYFSEISLAAEFFEWLKQRSQAIVKVNLPNSFN